VEVLTNLIKKRGGLVISAQEISKSGCDFVISSRYIPKHQLCQNLESLIKESSFSNKNSKNTYKHVLDYNYIIDCEKEGKILPISSYELESNFPNK
jgi:hypothetical protein